MVKQIWKSVAAVLAVLCATSSLVSLTSRVIHVGLAPVFLDYITYYRLVTVSIVQPLIEVVSLPHPPAIYYDLWPLSFVGGAAHFWAFSSWRNKPEAKKFLGRIYFSRTAKPLVLLAFGFTMTGLVVILAAIFVIVSARFVPAQERDKAFCESLQVMRRVMSYCVVIVIATILFFILNAYAPGVAHQVKLSHSINSPHITARFLDCDNAWLSHGPTVTDPRVDCDAAVEALAWLITLAQPWPSGRVPGSPRNSCR